MSNLFRSINIFCRICNFFGFWIHFCEFYEKLTNVRNELENSEEFGERIKTKLQYDYLIIF